MKVLTPILCILICFWHCSNIPNSTTELFIEVNTTDKEQGFIDFVVAGTRVWALTNDSLLVTFDIESNQKSKVRFNNHIKVKAIAKDKKGNIVIADSENRIGKYESGYWNFTNKLSNPIKAIFYTGQNDEYLLTDDGILDVKNNKSYSPDSSLNHQLRLPNVFRRRANYIMDSQDNIWLGYNHGEWGGDIYIFNTKVNKFFLPQLINFDIELNPIFAFTEAPDGVYFSGGLSHLYRTTGYIGKFQNFTANILFSNELDELSKDSAKRKGHYIGPISYNQWDAHLYFYSQHGFYKHKPNSSFSKAENWTMAAKPELLWTSGQSNATGYAMNVIKIVPIGPGAFLFLTDQNGIGHFNGKALTMFS